MKERDFSAITVSKRAEISIKNGHPWVFETEITAGGRDVENGDIVDILNPRGAYIATGFYNEHSKIRLRVLSRNANDKPDRAFFERLVRRAVDYRRTVMGADLDCCRMVFGESDGMPGLTVDRFGTVLVVQTLSLGMERHKEEVMELLVSVLEEYGCKTTGIFERNDVAIREREGMTQGKGWMPGYEGDTTDVIIVENGIKYHVDIENGQKTGFFLDQKFNRAACAKIAKGRRVLDCFTHTGSFALNCAAGGAQSVTAVDISQDALDTASANAQLNGLDVDFVCENVFDLLSSMKKDHKYDFIILDPPAFTKSRSTVESAIRGYKEINLRAMKLLPRGGYLATCSCSHFVGEDKFREMLKSAASDAGVSLRQIEARQQSADHPILWNVPETDYLKFFILQKV
ncbi:MAG: class I SAM-dependent rRNA methyltransferase [Ruminococcaceae bacterium]|nr:class I SAM-dependent rRNA methyltransferase [Oscillospiraceae bacterium]